MSAGGSHLRQWGAKILLATGPTFCGYSISNVFGHETHQVSPGLCSILVASYGPDTWGNEAGLIGINYEAANRGGRSAAPY